MSVSLRKVFWCTSWCNLVHSKRKKRLQTLSLQECCGASVVSHLGRHMLTASREGRTSSEQRNHSSLTLVRLQQVGNIHKGFAPIPPQIHPDLVSGKISSLHFPVPLVCNAYLVLYSVLQF